MTALENSALKRLLQKEAQGILTPDEKQELDDWYSEFDLSQENLTIFRDYAHETQIRQRLLDRIVKAGFPDSNIREKPVIYRMWVKWASLAAIILLVVSAGLLWKKTAQHSGADIVFLTFQTGPGQLKQLKLDDGSEIWLNAGSKLRVPEHFGGNSRELYLDGEAYFDVHHDTSRPFIVHTDRLNTCVLGTAFSVTAYKNTPVQAVTVIRGMVQVAHERHSLGFLTPNRRLEYRLKEGKARFSDINAAALMSWKDGKLQFEDQDMQDIAARLEDGMPIPLSSNTAKSKIVIIRQALTAVSRCRIC